MSNPVFALVCKDWNGHDVYTRFYDDKAAAIKQAERMPGVIRVEEAHAGKPPVWTRPDA